MTSRGARTPVRPHPAPWGRRLSLLLAVAACLSILPARGATGGDEPFTGPSNLGLTGLLETPTARVMTENRYRVGGGQVAPYRFVYGTIGLFDRLEVNGRVTVVTGVPGFDNNSSYGNFKDKAVDLKLQLVKEGKYLPALAVAILDPQGTRLYSAQALVASKQIYPFDFSVGLGNGRLGKRPLPGGGERFGLELFTHPAGWWRDSRWFGGIEFAPFDWLSLLAEYSPIRYDRQTSDPAQKKYFASPAASPINVGIRLKPARWAEIDASYQRGNRIGVSGSLSFDIGKPFLPLRDPPYRERPGARFLTVAGRIEEALSESGFSDIGVRIDGGALLVEAQNDRWFFDARAIQVVLETAAPLLPPEVETVRVTIKENGIARIAYSGPASAVAALPSAAIPKERFLALSTLAPAKEGPFVRESHKPRRFDYGLKPTVETFLNDPSGFFKYRLGLSAWGLAFPWSGGTLLLGAEGYPVNTVSSAIKPLSIPVRSDVVEYKKEKAALGRLLFEQIAAAGGRAYGRIAAGLLEVEYAGADAEVAAPLLHGRILLGAGGSAVRKREPGEPFGIVGSRSYHTAFANARLNVPEADVVLDVKGGRFLAGDKGARITLSKNVNGVILSAWYGITDTSIFQDDVNRGYRDKGISVDIPLRLFLGRDSKTSYRFSLTPWTRDVAQDIDHYRTLFDYIGRGAGVFLDKDKESLYR